MWSNGQYLLDIGQRYEIFTGFQCSESYSTQSCRIMGIYNSVSGSVQLVHSISPGFAWIVLDLPTLLRKWIQQTSTVKSHVLLLFYYKWMSKFTTNLQPIYILQTPFTNCLVHFIFHIIHLTSSMTLFVRHLHCSCDIYIEPVTYTLSL